MIKTVNMKEYMVLRVIHEIKIVRASDNEVLVYINR